MSGDDITGLVGFASGLIGLALAVIAIRRADNARRTGDATAADGGYANTGTARRPPPAPIDYDRSVLFADQRNRIAADFAEDTRTVILSREAANRVETLLVNISHNPDAQHALHFNYDGLRVAGLRQAISNAIEASDRERWAADDPQR